MAVYTPSSLNRVAAQYNLPAKEIVAVITPQSAASVAEATQSSTNGDESAVTDLQTWGQTIKVALNDPKGVPIEIQLSLLQAGTYLNKTRTAAYLWIRENRNTATQLLATQYIATNLANADPGAPVDKWLQHLETQSMSSNRVAWSGQQLMTTPVTDGCTVLPGEFRLPLVQALGELIPKEMKLSCW